MYERPSSRKTWAKFQALLTICWLSLLMMPHRAFHLLRVSLLGLFGFVGARPRFSPLVPGECGQGAFRRVHRSGPAAPTCPGRPASGCFAEGGQHAVSQAEPECQQRQFEKAAQKPQQRRHLAPPTAAEEWAF